MLKHVEAGVLRVAYEEHGPQDGTPVVFLHGFPYDVRVYDEVVPLLMGAGCRVLDPYLRGYGPTRFLSDDTSRHVVDETRSQAQRTVTARPACRAATPGTRR
jgi:pimeloyl-ACP methyl ester carboxylesterase